MRKMHAKLSKLITNLNAHVRIWMLEKTLPGMVAKLNALDSYLNLNDVNANFLTEVRIWMTEIQIWTTDFMAQIYFANLNVSFIK